MDKELLLYYACILIGVLISAVVDLLLGRKRGIPTQALKMYIAFGVAAGMLGALLMGQLQNFIMSLSGLDFVPSRLRLFGTLLFTPLLLYIPVKKTGGDFGMVTDVFTPGMFTVLGVSKIGCAIYGCCYGIPFEGGVASRFCDERVFPVQLLECTLTLILAFAVFFVLQTKKCRNGIFFPLSLIIYGIIRFFCEYLRYYTEAERTLFLGFSFWQMMSLVTIAVGAVWLIVAVFYKSRKNRK